MLCLIIETNTSHNNLTYFLIIIIIINLNLIREFIFFQLYKKELKHFCFKEIVIKTSPIYMYDYPNAKA